MQSQMIEVTDDELDRVLADQLLERWYYYTSIWRPNLGVPRIAPYCKQSKSSRQYEESSDLSVNATTKKELEDIDWCVAHLEMKHSAAIGIEMKNRQVQRKVWRCAHASSYVEALHAVMPIMRGRGLFD